MEIKQPTLLQVIEAIKASYPEEYREALSVSYEGRKVEFEGEIWYEITTADGTSYTAWTSILDGEVTTYDGQMLAPEDRIPEIDAIIAASE